MEVDGEVCRRPMQSHWREQLHAKDSRRVTCRGYDCSRGEPSRIACLQPEPEVGSLLPGERNSGHELEVSCVCHFRCIPFRLFYYNAFGD